MDAATLATYENKTIGRQSLRRGRRTIYIRTYDVAYGSSPPLPEAGDFLPGETSGACVTASGVTITPADNKTFKGLRVTVVAQQPVYNDLDSNPSTFDLGAYFVEASPSDDGGQSETSVGNSQYDSWRFEVPAASWAGLSDIPNKGDATPALLGGSGYVLSKVVDRESVPGFVVCKLVTGWHTTYFGSLTKVSSRLVTVREPWTLAADGSTHLSGPVSGNVERQRWAVDGDDHHNESYTQITITSIVASVPPGWQGSNADKCNNSTVSIRGVTFAPKHVLFVGGATSDVAAKDSPTGSAAIQLTLVLLASRKEWKTSVNRYKETLKGVKVEEVDENGQVIGHRYVQRWVRAKYKTDSPTVRSTFNMTAALGALP